jgi:dihydropteroate synthase
MRKIRVDEYGIRIMVPKAITRLVRVNAVSNITANILKQEMLSLGGDVAVARGALTGKTKKTDCLLIGSLAQFSRLRGKLVRQPFGLHAFARQLADSLAKYHTDSFIVEACGRNIRLSGRPLVMGIVNLTPDSFSGDGLMRWHRVGRADAVAAIVQRVGQMVGEGADMIDIGGESSRPGAVSVSVKEELTRVIPVIKALAKIITVPISIDTYKPEVARQALASGAVIVNDITGLRQHRMRKIIARYRAAAIIMHMQGNPRTMQQHPAYACVVSDICAFFRRRIEEAADDGITPSQVIVDPGLGFGKALGHNLEILKRLGEFRVLGRPILIGPSRKSFIGTILKAQTSDRLNGSLSACLVAACNGAKILRVHDVKAVSEAMRIFNSIQSV